MSTEDQQLKNVRNRVIEYIRISGAQRLIKIALFLKVKVPEKLIEKYKFTLK